MDGSRRGGVFHVLSQDLILDLARRKASEKYEVKACFSNLANKYMGKEEAANTISAVKTMAEEEMNVPSPTKGKWQECLTTMRDWATK